MVIDLLVFMGMFLELILLYFIPIKYNLMKREENMALKRQFNLFSIGMSFLLFYYKFSEISAFILLFVIYFFYRIFRSIISSIE